MKALSGAVTRGSVYLVASTLLWGLPANAAKPKAPSVPNQPSCAQFANKTFLTTVRSASGRTTVDGPGKGAAFSVFTTATDATGAIVSTRGFSCKTQCNASEMAVLCTIDGTANRLVGTLAMGKSDNAKVALQGKAVAAVGDFEGGKADAVDAFLIDMRELDQAAPGLATIINDFGIFGGLRQTPSEEPSEAVEPIRAIFKEIGSNQSKMTKASQRLLGCGGHDGELISFRDRTGIRKLVATAMGEAGVEFYFADGDLRLAFEKSAAEPTGGDRLYFEKSRLIWWVSGVDRQPVQAPYSPKEEQLLGLANVLRVVAMTGEKEFRCPSK